MTQSTNTSDKADVARALRGKHIAFSGFMACGKSTAVEQLTQRLQAQGITVHVTRFRPLYPSFHAPTLRGGRRGRPSSGLSRKTATSNKIQPSAVQWDKAFGAAHFVNNLVPLLLVLSLRMIRRRSVTVFDRYFYDYYIHYQPSGMWFRLARWLTPQPDVAFVLHTRPEELLHRTEKRSLEVTEKESGLNAKEQQALVAAHNRYEHLAEQWPHVVAATMNTASDHEFIWDSVLEIANSERNIAPAITPAATHNR